MTEHEFFQQDQLQWFTEFVEQELSTKVDDTHTHREFFEFDDVPF